MGKSPLRTVLKNFLDHYQNLEESLRTSRAAVKEMAGRETPPPLSLYAQEFLKLKELTESLKNDSNCPMIEGHSDVNKKKNRYKDILPYDSSRVILSEYPGVPGSDYINANYVRGSSGNQRAYIASQGPLPNTLVDFWRMIWETEILVIVMACNEREAGKYKCEPYWPLNTDEKQQYGNITVEHVKWRQVCPDFLVRTFKVSADSEERTICQFHYTTWPDHGVPSSVQPILELVRLMRDVQSSESRPILVHCSAGCGRTGTLCSIDYVWALLRTGKLREDFSLFDIISDMRRQRIAMVQTVEQYMLCYKAVATLFEQHLKLIDSHTYENVDDDGEPLGIKDLINQGTCSSIESLDETKPDADQANSDEESESSDADENQSEERLELCEARPHEKLIGKATVIRRPSIAKLKAIFDNSNCNTNNNETDFDHQPTSSRATRLQRSQSIKENFRNFNFNFHLEINQPKLPNRKSKSYTLSAAKLSVYKKNHSFANLVLNQEKNHHLVNRTKVTDVCFDPPNDPNAPGTEPKTRENNEICVDDNRKIESSDKSNCSSDLNVMVDSREMNYQPVISRTQTVSNNYPNNHIRFNSHSRPPSLNESNRGAPPKPPRTYQHMVDDSCIIKTSEGRLIVTVAQPRHRHSNHLQEAPNNSDCSYDQPDSIYEQLGARKYSYQSSPNLTIADRITFVPSGAPQSSFHMAPQPPQPPPPPPQPPIKSMNYCDNYTNSNGIYSNPLISKSFPLPVFPAIGQSKTDQMLSIPRSNDYAAYGHYSPYIDVMNNQHFQNLQAKPIMLQHGYYEPIYGTANNNHHHHHHHHHANPFLNQRPPPPPPQIQNSNILHGMQPPNRSKSMTSRLAANHHPLPESIYGNREMCFNVPHSFADNNIAMPAKENIYTEISIKQQQQQQQKNTTIQNEAGQIQSPNQTDNNANNLKNSRFDKFRRAFKMFRFKASSSQTPPKLSSSSSLSSGTTATDPANCSNINAPASNNVAKLTNNGVPINPINGQPLTRPPHCHRFQNATQWTQV